MIINQDNLQKGSLLFIRCDTFLSKMIRGILRFGYSHVAVYLGNGSIIESDWDGVKVNPLSKYSEKDTIEVVNTELPPESRSFFVNRLLYRKDAPYDYLLLLGMLLSRLFHRPRSFPGLFDIGNHYVCSEIVACSLAEAGVEFKLPISQITPEDLYNRFKK